MDQALGVLAEHAGVLRDGVRLAVGGLVKVVLIVLDDFRRDLMPDHVLLRGTLGGGRRAGDRHARAGPVGDEIRGRGDAGDAIVRVQHALVTSLGGDSGVAVVAGDGGEVASPAALAATGGIAVAGIKIVGHLQALDCGVALLRDVADDVGNSIRLVLQMTVCDILEAGRRKALGSGRQVLDESALGF